MMTRTQGSIIKAIVNGVLAAEKLSLDIPWLLVLQKEIPNIESEFKWCTELLELDTSSNTFAAKLVQHYRNLHASVNLSYLGISEISFVDTPKL